MAPMERRRSELGRTDSVGGSNNVVDWETLPITQRGLFQRDDFFQAHRESFDAAVQRALQRFSEDTASGSGTATAAADTSIPLLRRYRRLKSTQPNKDDIPPVVTSLQDDQHHKIVLDVRDFMSGNLSVKVAGGEGGEVVVHGVVDDEASTSASTSGVGEQKKRTFIQKFNLPSDASAEDASPAVSSDGVLTIITPKKKKPMSSESKPQEQDEGSDKTEVKGNGDVTRTPEVRQRRRQRQPILIDVKDFMTDGEVKVKALNEKDLFVEGRVEMDDNERVSVKTFRRRFSLPENAEIDSITSVVSSDGVLAITTPKKAQPKKEIETIIPITIEGSDIEPTVKRQESLNRKESFKNKEPVRRNESLKKAESAGRLDVLKKSEPLKRTESLKSPEPLRKRITVKRSESLKKTELLSRENMGKSSNLLQKPESKEHIIPIQIEADKDVPTNVEVDIPIEKESTSSKLDKDDEEKPDANSNDSKKEVIVRRRNSDAISNDSKKEVIVRKPEANSNDSKKEVIVRKRSTNISPTLKIDTCQSDTNKYLPIERRGLFFSDSFFEDVQSEYKSAVGVVLTKYGFTSNKEDMSFYRLLRERSQNEDNQASCTCCGDHYHKIIVDVADFLEEDVNIEIVNDNELILEGHQNKTDCNDTIPRNFKRKYIFPKSFNMGSISCSRSEDGVIVIKAIKTSIDKSDNENGNSVISILITTGKNSENTDIPSIKEPERERKKSVSEIAETKEVKTVEAEPKKDISVNKISSANKETSNDKDNSTNKDTSTNKDNLTSKDSSTSKDNSKNIDTSNSKDNSTKQDTPEGKSTEEGTILPISKKGSFFSDVFFEEAAQRNLETAIRDVLKKTGLSPIDDDFKFYRNMREKSTSEQNQAVNSTENDKSYKIVIDVQGYDENNVKVIIVSEKEILVEGQQEIKDKSNTATRIFRRKFLLSNSIKTAAVVSAVSSDGILTITAPKKVVGLNGTKGKKEVSSHVTINSKNPKKIEAVHEVSSETTKKL